jgi:hypothetical protein
MTTIDKLKMGAMMLTTGVVSGLMGYGLYGYYRDKGMSTWSAGALTGVIGGAVGAMALMALPASMVEGYTAMSAPRVAGLQFMPTGSTRGRLRIVR